MTNKRRQKALQKRGASSTTNKRRQEALRHNNKREETIKNNTMEDETQRQTGGTAKTRNGA